MRAPPSSATSHSSSSPTPLIDTDTGSQSRAVIREEPASYRRYAASGQAQRIYDGAFPEVIFVAASEAAPRRYDVDHGRRLIGEASG